VKSDVAREGKPYHGETEKHHADDTLLKDP
jgi:hypothetical protein